MTLLRHLARAALLAAAVACAAPAFAADPPPAKPVATFAPAQLETFLKDAATFRYAGADPKTPATDKLMRDAEEQIILAARAGAPQRQAAEQSILKLLISTSATRDAKEFACRQLLIVGSNASIPALEPLLQDKDLAHVARLALGRLALTSPDAAAILRAALKTTTGDLRIGVINSLGELHDPAAINDLRAIALNPADAPAATAAVVALGKIRGATDASLGISAAQEGPAASAVRSEADHALLAAAERLLAADKRESAAAVFQVVHNAAPSGPVKTAALRGLLLTRGPAATEALVTAIKAPDLTAARQAIAFTRLIPKDIQLSKTLVELLPTLPPERQETLVRALGVRPDDIATAAILEAATFDKPLVRVAALDTLGDVGGASAVTVLATAAVKGGDDQKAAREALLRLSGDAIGGQISTAIDVPATPPKVKAELVRALAGRRTPGATERLFTLAKTDPEADVRREAIAGLGSLAGPADLKPLIDLAVTPKDPGDRGPFEDALAAAFRRSGDAKAATALVAGVVTGAPADARPPLVRLYKAAASPEALAALRPLLTDPDKQVADAAVRTLADWPDPAAADDLLGVVKTSDSKTHQVLALKGYIRLTGAIDKQSPGAPAKQLAMYQAALDLAQRPDEKRQILSGLANLATPEALALSEKLLTDTTVTAEAAQAVIGIVTKSAERDKQVRDRAKESLTAVIAVAEKDAKLKKQAEDALVVVEKFKEKK